MWTDNSPWDTAAAPCLYIKDLGASSPRRPYLTLRVDGGREDTAIRLGKVFESSAVITPAPKRCTDRVARELPSVV